MTMRLLSIDSAGDRLGAAVLAWSGEGTPTTLACLDGRAARDHGRRLLPLVIEVCAGAGTAAEALTLVTVGRGPGSYTGLRVGIATALGVAVAGAIPVHGVESLRAAALGSVGRVAVVADAGRGGFYAQAFEGRGERRSPGALGPAVRLDAGALAAFLAQVPGAGPLHRIALGDLAAAALGDGDPSVTVCRSAVGPVAIGRLACARFAEGVSPDEQALAVTPIYLRPAAAAARG